MSGNTKLSVNERIRLTARATEISTDLLFFYLTVVGRCRAILRREFFIQQWRLSNLGVGRGI